ncbi:class I tRNA ligase family protein, partial [bacterium]|nr:class I tRNA ligase family protein [bacterium]
DTDAMSFNTAIARMMEFTNFFTRAKKRPAEAMRTFIVLLAPYAPHLCEELWRLLGGKNSVSLESWPQWDEAALIESSIEIPVQINGKVKVKISISPDTSRDSMMEIALGDERVQALLEDKTLVKQIAVPGRLVNLVVK